MKKTKAILAACIIVVLAACNKEKSATPALAPAQNGKFLALSSGSPDPYANAKNPYDSIGAIHNKALNVVWDYVQQTKDTTATGICGQVSDFFRQRYGADINDRLKQADLFFTKDFAGREVARVPNGNFSAASKLYLNNILDAIRQIKSPDGYGAFYSSVVSIEGLALSDKNLPVAERGHILMVASVARYSLGFWMQKAASASPGGQSDLMGFFGNIWRAINCGLADAGGAIDGIGRGESIREIIEDASFESSLCSAFM